MKTQTTSSEIWVFQSSFVGDCVLSLAFLNELLKIQPEARVKLVTQSGIQSQMFHLARDRGLQAHFSRLEILDFHKKDLRGLKNIFKSSEWIRKKRTPHIESQYAFCLHRSFRTAFMAYMTGAREKIGFSSGAASFMYTKAIPRTWDRGAHEIEKNLDLLRSVFGVDKVPVYLGASLQKRPSLLSAQDSNKPKRVQGRVSLALGSPWPTKRWPLEHAISLCKNWVEEGIEIYLLGDSSATEQAHHLQKSIPSILIKNFVGQTTAQEWVDLLDSSSLLVSGDSASVHVASDLGVPVLALFGPTVPEFGFAPWRTHSKVLQRSDLECRPCHIHGPKVCPLKHHKCLKELDPDSVLRHAKSYLLVDP